MWYAALMFFVVAVLAVIVGFGGIDPAAAPLARVMFFICVILSMLSLLAGLLQRHPPTPIRP